MINRVNDIFFTNKIRVNATEVTSKFHFTSLDHIKQIPFHLISTPKCPINFDKSGHKNILLQPKFYKGMSTELYCREMRIDFELVRNFGVYVHNEDTSMIFEVIESAALNQ